MTLLESLNGKQIIRKAIYDHPDSDTVAHTVRTSILVSCASHYSYNGNEAVRVPRLNDYDNISRVNIASETCLFRGTRYE